MSEFEKWFKSEEDKCFKKRFYQKPSIRDAFEAGAQSKQAEIDELRKLIDDAIERSNHAHIGYQMLYKQFDDVMKILKGTTNEQ